MTQADSVHSTPRTNSPIERPAESVDSLTAQPATRQPENGERTSESRKPAEGLSRRTMLGALAVLPVALPTTAPALTTLTDPIFAALDTWQQAQAAMDAVPQHEDNPDEIGDQYWAACTSVMHTRPTTPAGLAALTGWLRQQVPTLHGMHSHEIAALVATLDDAARGMSGLEPWSPPAQTEASEPDPVFEAVDDCRVKRKASDARYVQVTTAYRKAKKAGLADPNTFVEAELGCHPDAYTDESAEDHWESIDDFFATEPTTVAGIVAYIRHANEVAGYDDEMVKENAVQMVETLLAATSRLA